MLDFEPLNHYRVEVTDTSGGEANYCWVKRYRFSLPLATEEGAAARRLYARRIVRAAKAAAGWTGLRCVTEPDSGFGFVLRPTGKNAPCWIMFVSYDNNPGDKD